MVEGEEKSWTHMTHNAAVWDPVDPLQVVVLWEKKKDVWFVYRSSEFNFPPCRKLNTSPDLLPRSVIWSSCHSCRWSSPWSRCPPYWQRLVWRSRRRSGTRRTFCPRCCCQWWGSWTYSQSFGPKTPSAHRSLLLRPSVDREEGENKKSINKMAAVTIHILLRRP